MPVLLTTPINPADLDPGKSYTHLKIDTFMADLLQNRIILTASYGYVENGTYVPSNIAPHKRWDIVGAEFLMMVQSLPNQGETIYGAVARRLYEWLIAGGHVIGTIV